MRTRIFLATAVVAALGAAAAYAHGEHHSRFNFKNDTDKSLKLSIYNGNDFDCVAAHQEKHISPGKTFRVKCHGKGRNRCFIGVKGFGLDRRCMGHADGIDVTCYETASAMDCDT